MLAAFALLLGPATGALHAVHLAHAGEHHHADDCSVCQQAFLGSQFLPEPAPAAIAGDDLSFLRLAISSQDCPRIHAPDPVLPRAPPRAACAKAV